MVSFLFLTTLEYKSTLYANIQSKFTVLILPSIVSEENPCCRILLFPPFFLFFFFLFRLVLKSVTMSTWGRR